MGNTLKGYKTTTFPPQSEHPDFRLIVHKNHLMMVSNFFERLLNDKPTINEYTLNTKYEAVEWMIAYFKWHSRQAVTPKLDLNGFDRDKFYEYYEFLYSLAVRYSVTQIHLLFNAQMAHGLTMENVVSRLELAVQVNDVKGANIFRHFIAKNGGKEKLIEIELSKLNC
ncbi:hypothetical protein M3Y94_00008500 [Aphelenchoides besseyi]|nr:hypothetical protein M3Y94_00008500 [Aphelenchoides besseyi]